MTNPNLSGVSEQGVVSELPKGILRDASGRGDSDALLSLRELEKRTGKTLYELFAAMYLSHHMVNVMPNGTKKFCQSAPMHHEMCEIFHKSHRNVIIAPGKFAKSTWTSIFQPLADGVLGLAEGDVLDISNTGRLAERWLDFIKTEILENEDLIHDFGKLQGAVWRQDRIKLKTGIEICSLGLNYQIRGTGWWKVNGDDMEDDEMVRSEDQREKFSDWFDGALLGRMHPHSFLNLIGTNLHPLCKIGRIHDDAEGRYETWVRKKYAALDENGESIWPSRWPTEVVEQQRIEMGEKAFLAEKMNAPIFGTNQIFRAEWVKYYDD